MTVLLLPFCLTACPGFNPPPPATPIQCAPWPPAPSGQITQKDVALWLETRVRPAYDDCHLVVAALNKEIHDQTNP